MREQRSVAGTPPWGTSGIAAADALDPFTFELIRYAVDAVNDEMLLTILRTARTSIIRDAFDVSVAIFTAGGEMAAQGFALPLHLGAIPDAMDAMRRAFASSLVPGDVLMMNDPYAGGTHLPDIYLCKPVFVTGCLLAFLVIVADFGDIGGRVPGSRNLDAQSIYEEGLRIPPIKYVDAGELNVSVRAIIGQNVRLPDFTLGDIETCLAALASAESLLVGMTAKFGMDRIEQYFRQAIDQTETITRQSFRALPEGSYSFADYLDDAVTKPDPVPIRLKLTVSSGELRFDFAGTADQVPASLNCTLAWTKSAVYAAVRTLLPSTLITNSGMFRPIIVEAPLGSLLNPRPPAPVAERGLTGFRIADCVLGALAKVVPDRVPAAGEGGSNTIRIGGQDDNGAYFILSDNVFGAWGGRPDRDGIDGISNFCANNTNRPIEVLEREYPIRIRRYGLAQDSGGPGRFRGGLGVNREWELLSGDATLSLRADRTRFRPWGLMKGEPGRATEVFLAGLDHEPIALPAKSHRALKRGDRVSIHQAAGGGYGDPFDRDADRVLRDWLEEKISLEHASQAYGVVIDTASRSVDREATNNHRKASRAARD